MTRSADEFLPLHPLELRILMLLLDGPSYGTEIVERIEAGDEGRARLYPANLYRRIRDLLGDGLIEDAPAPRGTDPRRSYVSITALGRSVAAAEARRLQDLVRAAVRHQLLPEG